MTADGKLSAFETGMEQGHMYWLLSQHVAAVSRSAEGNGARRILTDLLHLSFSTKWPWLLASSQYLLFNI